MTSEDLLHPCSATSANWLQVRNRLATTHDRETLTSVLDRVEKVGKLAGGIGGTYLGHSIRLSDFGAGVPANRNSRLWRLHPLACGHSPNRRSDGFREHPTTT